jgi:hypothetical protein
VTPVVDAFRPCAHDRPELWAHSFSDERVVVLESREEDVAERRGTPEAVPDREHHVRGELVEREALLHSPSQRRKTDAEVLHRRPAVLRDRCAEPRVSDLTQRVDDLVVMLVDQASRDLVADHLGRVLSLL